MGIREDVDTWVESNPLRVWRKKNRMGVMQTATALGVSMTIIQLWERGTHIPSDENFDKLVALIGKRIVRDWSNWYSSKPGV